MHILNTSSVDEVYNSLDDILDIQRGSVKDFYPVICKHS